MACEQHEPGSRIHVFETETLPHWSVLYQAAYSLLDSRVEAEDEVQETYLQAWKSFDAFEPGTNCRAWLFSILFNKVRHHRRKWTFRFRLSDDPSFFEKTLEVEHFAINDELSDPEILEALRKLPQSYAEAILLSDVEELSYKEISKTIGRPIGTVMSRISRGRGLLRISLARVAEDRRISTKSVPKLPVDAVA